MFKEIALINYPVKDLALAKSFYTSMLAVEPYMDTEAYVGYQVGNLNIGLNPNGYDEGMVGPVIFWRVDDIESAVQEAKDNGATLSREPQQLGPQILASLIGSDGILFGLLQKLN